MVTALATAYIFIFKRHNINSQNCLLVCTIPFFQKNVNRCCSLLLSFFTYFSITCLLRKLEFNKSNLSLQKQSIYSIDSCVMYFLVASCQVGSLSNPFSASTILLSLLLSGLCAFVGYSLVSMPFIFTAIPASLKIS